tara:strand:+ start:3188 stop:4582 length:1395 start_codon:yes stop_codon:yes gene_type:complete
MSITITSGGFDGVIRSDTDGNIFIETVNNTKKIQIGGLVEYTGSITRQLDKVTGKTIRETERVLSTGKTFQRSGSATANQIEFQQTTVGAFITTSGSSGNTGFNLVEADKTKLIRSTHNTHISGGTSTTTAVNQLSNGGNWQYNVNTGILKTRTANTQFTVSSSGDAFVKNNLIIGGNLTAEQYIVSSSVTNVTTLAQSGSTKFGDDQADTHEFTGSVKITGSMDFDGLAEINLTNITASGQISASGQLIAASADFNDGNISSVGIIDLDTIRGDGDTNTNIAFGGDKITFKAGNEALLTLTEGEAITGRDVVIVGDGGDVDFQVKTTGDDNAIYALGSSDNVGIGTNAPAKKLTVVGDISSSGDMFSGQFIQLTNSQSVVDTFSTSSFQTCKYVLQVTSASNIQSSEMLVMQNSSNAFNTEYAQINSGLNLTNFSTKVNLSNVELISSSSFVSCSVKFVRTLI